MRVMMVSHSTIRLVLKKPATYAFSVFVSTLFFDLEDAAALDAGPIGQGEDPRLEGLVLHRPEAVEERGNPDRRDQIADDDERDQGEGAVEPPAASGSSEAAGTAPRGPEGR